MWSCRLSGKGWLGIAPNSFERVKERIREITRRNRWVSVERMIWELNSFTSGWVTYFRLAQAKDHMQRLDEWTRRAGCGASTETTEEKGRQHGPLLYQSWSEHRRREDDRGVRKRMDGGYQHEPRHNQCR